MARIAKPQSPHSEALRTSLNAYLERTATPLNAYAKSQGVNQSTLYRFSTGQTKEPTQVLIGALNYAHNALATSVSAPIDAPALSLRQLALKACGNRLHEALILEQLVFALAPLVRRLTAQMSSATHD